MPEKQLRRMNAHYALIQGLFWGGYATIWAFLTVLLLYRGFSNSQIGVVSFLALTLPIVVQPGLAALADRDGRFTSRRLGLALVCLAATAAGVMWAWGANLQLLRKYPRFVLLLAACALLMACHSSSCTYMIHIVERAGAGSGAMGAALALAAFLELPAMGLFSRMRQRLSLAWLLRLCAGAFLAKIVVFWLAESMTAIYLASVLQFFEYGIFTPATVYYVVEHIDRGNQVKGQALISVASSGVGSAFGSLCCGLILDRAGVSGMLLFEVACAAAGCVVMLLATGEGKRK